MEEVLHNFQELLQIMERLRKECPWDRKQTFDTLRHLTIEEVYELADAIIVRDYDEIREELGDILLHVVFYALLGREEQRFDINDVLQTINKKLIERHPHVFGNVKVKDDTEVKENWEKIKLQQNEQRSVLDGVPSSLPSLIKAYRIQEKARGVGFEWEHKDQVWQKVIEELNEFKHAVEQQASQEKLEEEFGDILFALVNYGRFLNINADLALEHTNQKFIERFRKMEQLAAERGQNFASLSLQEQDKLWNEVKASE